MDIFKEIQPSCPKCGKLLKRDVSLRPSEGGTIESLPSGSTSQYYTTYDIGPQELGYHLSCPNIKCGFREFRSFASFDQSQEG